MKITATTVMIRNVYAVAAAEVVVRLAPSASVVGMTSGNSATKRPATAVAMVRNVPMNAQPSRPMRTATRPATRHTAATTNSTAEPTFPLWNWVHNMNGTATSAAQTPTRRARSLAAWRIRPSVLSEMNIAPCVTKRSRVVAPPSSAYGFRRLKNPPTYSPSMSIGTPRTMLAKATPHNRAGTKEPMMMARSQRLRHWSSSRLARYSKASPRTISASKMRSSGR